jgi:hypothetical protein
MRALAAGDDAFQSEVIAMRLLPALALSASVALGACANPDGSLNVPGTLALGAGAAIAGLAIASASRSDRHDSGYYDRRGYGHGPRYGRDRGYHAHGYGYGRSQRGW